MPFNHSWPDLVAFNATGRDRARDIERAQAFAAAYPLRVTEQGIEPRPVPGPPSVDRHRARLVRHLVAYTDPTGGTYLLPARKAAAKVAGQARAEANRNRKAYGPDRLNAAQVARAARRREREEGGIDIHVSLSPAIESMRNTQGEVVSTSAHRATVARTAAPTTQERGSRPHTSYAERRAAVVAARGW